MIDDGLAEVSQVWRMHKDKSRALVGEELAFRRQNAEVSHAAPPAVSNKPTAQRGGVVLH